ncbi:alcohol dehydrogenase catalytic domain-containing protein [bacterium]|nr:alcohol dehydrogenase catalytic domain-containing protein [bacterium]
MRVIALYGPRDVREEEWPKPDPGPGDVRIRIKSVCICGSDKTQYELGRIGELAAPVPFLLGHEAAGLVDAVGPGVTGLVEGMPVAVEPAMPCMACDYCLGGRHNLCTGMRFLGSPPVHGALAEYLVMPARNVFPVKARISYAEIACIEPLAIALHALRLVPVGLGERVAIFGAGGIGQALLIAVNASGARVTAVTDMVPSRLALADQLGAGRGYNAAEDAGERILELTAGRGVEVSFVTAGAPDALRDAVRATARGGRIAVIGTPHEDEWGFPVSACRRKQLRVQFVYRSNHTMKNAAELVERGDVCLGPLVTHRLPWERAEEAFEMALRNDDGTLRIALEPEDLGVPYYH